MPDSRRKPSKHRPAQARTSRDARPNAAPRGGKPAGKARGVGDDPKPPRKVAQPELAGEEALRTPAVILEGWETAVLSLARLPRGTAWRDTPKEELLEQVIRQEMKGVIELWETYTQERSALSRRLLDARAMAVRYLIGFHIPNTARMQLALSRAARRGRIGRAFSADGPNWLWHDVAGGTGAAATALAAFALDQGLPREKLSLMISDANGGLLDAARAGLGAAFPDVALRTARLAVEDLDPRRQTQHQGAFGYSLSYAWNELARNQAARSRLQFLWKGHIERGDEALLVILEPASEAICRDAMALRDSLCAMGYVPLYPCPSAAPCPMLQSDRDWCYSEAMWMRPHVVQWLDRTIGIDRGTISTSAFVLASPALIARLHPEAEKSAMLPRAPVVVGRPQHRDDRGRDYLLCKGDALAKEPVPADAIPLARGLAWSAAQAKSSATKNAKAPPPVQKSFKNEPKKPAQPGKKFPPKGRR